MSRRHVSLLVGGAALVLVLILAPEVPFVVFAGVLVAVFISAGSRRISRWTGLGRGWSNAIFLVGLIAVLATVVTLVMPPVLDQVDALVRTLPDAVDALEKRIERYAWLDSLLGSVRPRALMPDGGTAATVAASTFGTFGNLVIVLFIGLYGAADPRLYRSGVKLLLAPSIRPRAGEVMDRCGTALAHWLGAQLVSMTIVGLLTWLGLWLIGLPLPFVFGLLAAFLTFIPNIGPIIAAAPAVLLATTEGPTTVLLVVATYVVVQTLESYLITPRLQQESVSLPPALLISSQVFFGVVFGLVGLILATPATVLIMTLANEVYRKDYLESAA